MLGYVSNESVRELLESTPILGGPENLLDDMRVLYGTLVKAGYFEDSERVLLDAWCSDIQRLGLE